ncbi:MAG: hypothetical protein PVI90_16175, partial [Desulfobacteraceae bacterium]
MKATIEMEKKAKIISMIPTKVPEDITEADEALFFKVLSTELSSKQRERIRTPTKIYPQQKAILGVHWQPDFIPMEDIHQRIEATFPNKDIDLIIPTQRNEFSTYGPYTGVKVDCYASSFNQKIQLLLHFESQRTKKCTRLHQMLTHTYKYRSNQLFDFMYTIINANEERIGLAVKRSGAPTDLVSFVRQYVIKIHALLEKYENQISPTQIKSRLLSNYFNGLRETYGNSVINRCQIYLAALKRIVRDRFSLNYFYRASKI